MCGRLTNRIRKAFFFMGLAMVFAPGVVALLVLAAMIGGILLSIIIFTRW